MKRSLLCISFVAAALLGISCKKDKGPEVKQPVEVESVTLNKSALDLYVGEDFELTAIIFPSEAEYQELTWSSSNEEVATVEDGLVSAVSDGTATIKVKCGGISAKCKVSVTTKANLQLYSVDDGEFLPLESELNIRILDTGSLKIVPLTSDSKEFAADLTTADLNVKSSSEYADFMEIKIGTESEIGVCFLVTCFEEGSAKVDFYYRDQPIGSTTVSSVRENYICYGEGRYVQLQKIYASIFKDEDGEPFSYIRVKDKSSKAKIVLDTGKFKCESTGYTPGYYSTESETMWSVGTIFYDFTEDSDNLAVLTDEQMWISRDEEVYTIKYKSAQASFFYRGKLK